MLHARSDNAGKIRGSRAGVIAGVFGALSAAFAVDWSGVGSLGGWGVGAKALETVLIVGNLHSFVLADNHLSCVVMFMGTSIVLRKPIKFALNELAKKY